MCNYQQSFKIDTIDADREEEEIKFTLILEDCNDLSLQIDRMSRQLFSQTTEHLRTQPTDLTYLYLQIGPPNIRVHFFFFFFRYTMDIQHLTYSTLLERLFQLSENVNTNMSRYPGGLPRQHCGKELPTSAGDTRDTGSIPGAGRSLGVGNPTQSRILAWSFTLQQRGVTKHQTQLDDYTHWFKGYRHPLCLDISPHLLWSLRASFSCDRQKPQALAF